MRITTRIAKAILLLTLVFMISCSDDDIEQSVPDYSIVTSDYFEIVSTYENGWIQEAIAKDINGKTITEIQYHANGYIKSCASYTPQVDGIPIHTRTVTRDENDQPVQSIYYNEDGSVLAEINYQNGLLKDKSVYKTGYTIISTYIDGVIQEQESTSDDGIVTTLTYDYTNQERHLEVVENDVLSHVAILPLNEISGEGINTENDLTQMNRFEGQPINETVLNGGYSSSIIWQSLYDLREVQPLPQFYDLTPANGLPHGYFSTAFDYYRSVIEEYPFIESELLQGKFYLLDKQLSINTSAIINDVNDEFAADPEGFKFNYGDQFLDEIFIGKFGFVVGTIRNLPSDAQTRRQLKDIAYKKANYLLGFTLALTQSEEEMLTNVFFEFKYFSPALGLKGVILQEPSDYENIITLIDDAGNWNIQQIYKAFEEI